MQIEKLKYYCEKMLLDFEIQLEYLLIENQVYKIITNTTRDLFDDEMIFIQDSNLDNDCTGFIFEFGGRWYTQDINEIEVQLKEFKYIGEAKQQIETKSFLGIHSSYELMNGIGLYKDWVEKAKFLGIKSLGICEKSTLSGVLAFQNECKNNGIKSIIGMTIPVKGTIEDYDVKVYARNFQGWLSLLKFNEELNILGKKQIDVVTLKNNSKDIYIIADPKSMDYNEFKTIDTTIFNFYQLETVKFLSEEKDIWFLENLESFMKSGIEPISIIDAYYLEKKDFEIRESLWTINKAFDFRTDNQFFKSNEQYVREFIKMFENNNQTWITLFKKAQKNEESLVEGCNFKYDTETRHLPKYVMTEKESKNFNDNNELFIHLLEKGLKEKDLSERPDYVKYINRLKAEIKVLKMGDTIDYFLILYDIVKYAKDKEMLTGLGRGSAGGSLVAYLLGIIHIDPLKFDLLFERFLNSGRMGKFEDRPLFVFKDEDGNQIELAEGNLARIIRDGKEMAIYCHDIKEGDEIIKY